MGKIHIWTTFTMVIACALFARLCYAEPQHLEGKWYLVKPYSLAQSSQAFLQNPLSSKLPEVSTVSLTGGHFLYVAPLRIQEAGEYVLDFKNTTTIGRFRHQVYDAQGRLLASLQGGIESREGNPFFLRHGRQLTLQPGGYTIASELISTNFLAMPEPYLDHVAHYLQAIKWGNLVALFGLGIFLGLGVYYTALAASRNRWAEAMYAGFILGNFIFNSAALLVFSDVLGIHSLYFVSMPVLLSNVAYILFVMHLLEVNKISHKRMYWAGVAIIGIMSLFLGLAIAFPNWALELCRYGVGLFLSYGLVTAIISALKKNATAKRYLIAISIFFISGFITISLNQIDSQFTFYIEHMGIVSVAIEVILLALVLSFQFSELQKEREKALEERDASVKEAHSDALTGLENRHALIKALAVLPAEGSMTFVDLDGLKFYNDTYGHERGDELLMSFANCYQHSLGDGFRLYRLGGDEFAVLNDNGNVARAETALMEALYEMKELGFDFAGASLGSVFANEGDDIADLMRIADARMYENKRLRKADVESRAVPLQ